MFPQTAVEFAAELPLPSKVENYKFLQSSLLKVAKANGLVYIFPTAEQLTDRGQAHNLKVKSFPQVPLLWLPPLSVPLSWFLSSPMH